MCRIDGWDWIGSAITGLCHFLLSSISCCCCYFICFTSKPSNVLPAWFHLFYSSKQQTMSNKSLFIFSFVSTNRMTIALTLQQIVFYFFQQHTIILLPYYLYRAIICLNNITLFYYRICVLITTTSLQNFTCSTCKSLCYSARFLSSRLLWCEVVEPKTHKSSIGEAWRLAYVTRSAYTNQPKLKCRCCCTDDSKRMTHMSRQTVRCFESATFVWFVYKQMRDRA